MTKIKEELARLSKMWQESSATRKFKQYRAKKKASKKPIPFEEIGAGYSIDAMGLSRFYKKT